MSTVPVLYLILWLCARENYFHVSWGTIMPSPKTQQNTPYFVDHTPLCCGLPQSNLSRRERGHTLHTMENINSLARDKTLPLKLASEWFSDIPLLFKLCWAQYSGHSQALTLRWNPVSTGVSEVFSAAEVTALHTVIRLAADTAE